MNRIEIVQLTGVTTCINYGYVELSYVCSTKELIDLLILIPDVVEFFNEYRRDIEKYKIRIKNTAGKIRATLNINRSMETTNGKKLDFIISGYMNFDKQKRFYYPISVKRLN